MHAPRFGGALARTWTIRSTSALVASSSQCSSTPRPSVSDSLQRVAVLQHMCFWFCRRARARVVPSRALSLVFLCAVVSASSLLCDARQLGASAFFASLHLYLSQTVLADPCLGHWSGGGGSFRISGILFPANFRLFFLASRQPLQLAIVQTWKHACTELARFGLSWNLRVRAKIWS